METRPENKRCSLCPQLPFSFSDLDHLTNPPPNYRVKQRIKLFQGVLFLRYQIRFFANIHIDVVLTFLFKGVNMTPPKGGNCGPPLLFLAVYGQNMEDRDKARK